MSVELSALRNALNGDIARPNLYRVNLSTPSFLSDTLDSNQLSLLIRSTSIPEQIINTIDVSYMGRILPFASDQHFPDFKISILNDQNLTFYKIFSHWMDGINNSLSNNSNVTNLVDYIADAKIYIMSRNLDKSDLLLRKISGIYPVNISPITLSADATDQPSVFEVNFKIVGGIDRTTDKD